MFSPTLGVICEESGFFLRCLTVIGIEPKDHYSLDFSLMGDVSTTDSVFFLVLFL